MANRKFTKRDIKKFAKHEAGHVTHHVLTFQHKFDFVWVRRSQEDEAPRNKEGQVLSDLGGCVYRSSDEEVYTTTFEWVANFMAGLAGERINWKKPGKMDFYALLTGCEGDWRAAQEAIRESNEKGLSKWVITDEDKYINMALKSAHSTLRAAHKAHEAVTNALIERGRLTYDEVKEIVYSNLGWNRG